MNEIVNEFLLAGDKFVLEIHLREPGFSYSPCEPVYPKCHFVFFDKLKYEIRNKVLIFVSILKLRQKTSK